MSENYIPGERLRIFISSAQRDENGFSWSEIRIRIKEHLKQCPYLNPFIIEDVASSSPSTQLYQRQVERADVVVLLVKGDVREGTAAEFALATKLRKPLLVYFLEDPNPGLDVLRLKKELQTTDYCTYRPAKSFDDIECKIQEDIIGDVIRYYQEKAYHSVLLNERNKSVSVSDMAESARPGVPNHTVIALFESSYDRIFELLNIGFKKGDNKKGPSVLHWMGTALIDWLVNGDPLNCDSEILKLIECAAELYRDTGWLRWRWDAIRHGLSGNIETALEFERKALKAAREIGMPEWIVNDILIDCRNFESEAAQENGQIYVDGAAQEELNQAGTIVYLPVADRYLDNLYNDIAKEEFRTRTASHNTMLLGSSLGTAVTNVVNYLFSAALYGSFTHLNITRQLLSRTLSKYADFTGNHRLLFKSVNAYILQGNAKDYRLYLRHIWDSIYSFVTTGADEMFYLAEKAPEFNRDGIMQAVLETIGQYLSNEAFARAEKYLFDYEKNVWWGNSEAYFECIYSNITRLNQGGVIDAISNIMADKRFHLGRKISNIISRLDLKETALEKQIKLRDALMERLPYIIESNGSPQMIVVLVTQNRAVFECLETLPGNGLTGIEEKYYQMNIGSGNWASILEEALDIAASQFEYNHNSGIYAQFSINPYATVSHIVREAIEEDSDHFTDIILKRFVPHAVEVMRSEAAIPAKSDCLACLCDVLSYLLRSGIALPASILEALQNVDINAEMSLLSTKNRDAYAMRATIVRIIAGISDRSELQQWCIGYDKRTANERLVLADCIEKYLYRTGQGQIDVDFVVLSIILQCFEDDIFDIRCQACRCLSYILNSQYAQLAESKLYKASLDPSHYVRNQLITLCGNGQITGGLSKQILSTLMNDANYAIKQYAANVMKAGERL